MDYSHILTELQENSIVSTQTSIVKVHKGGTDGFVLEISDNGKNIGVKTENHEAVKNTASFFQKYTDISLFPKILFQSKKHGYFAYSFLPGEQCSRPLTIEELSFVIHEVFNKYKTLKQWGVKSHTFSLLQYNLEDIESAKTRIQDLLPEQEYKQAMETAQYFFSNFDKTLYSVHGDPGIHNVLIENEAITGIIDPYAIFGLPILDYLYLVASKPTQLSIEEVITLSHQLHDRSGFSDKDIRRLYKMMLYIRIGIATKHHPYDIPDYLNHYNTI